MENREGCISSSDMGRLIKISGSSHQHYHDLKRAAWFMNSTWMMVWKAAQMRPKAAAVTSIDVLVSLSFNIESAPRLFLSTDKALNGKCEQIISFFDKDDTRFGDEGSLMSYTVNMASCGSTSDGMADAVHRTLRKTLGLPSAIFHGVYSNG